MGDALPYLKSDDECVMFIRALSRGDGRILLRILEERMERSGAVRVTTIGGGMWEATWDRAAIARALRYLANEIGGADDPR